ncbi:hypothetical protein HMPREF9069_01907 [Atopobium sp. oral taxon 810 str. F0209]|nr:hypothetical protein HMPREF9069_01907 [Atopobium sp. oral taxon 810 str. F0209]
MGLATLSLVRNDGLFACEGFLQGCINSYTGVIVAVAVIAGVVVFQHAGAIPLYAESG